MEQPIWIQVSIIREDTGAPVTTPEQAAQAVREIEEWARAEGDQPGFRLDLAPEPIQAEVGVWNLAITPHLLRYVEEEGYLVARAPGFPWQIDSEMP